MGGGPPSAASGSYYMYCETSSPNYPSGYFEMSRTVTAGSIASLSFQYHMYGYTMGTVTLEAYAGAWVSAWTKSGNLGNSWRSASTTVVSGATILRFKCVPNPSLSVNNEFTQPSPPTSPRQVHGGIKLYW